MRRGSPSFTSLEEEEEDFLLARGEDLRLVPEEDLPLVQVEDYEKKIFFLRK